MLKLIENQRVESGRVNLSFLIQDSFVRRHVDNFTDNRVHTQPAGHRDSSSWVFPPETDNCPCGGRYHIIMLQKFKQAKDSPAAVEIAEAANA
ncbi:MAG: hypothetical protein IJ231_07330 [Clostridia bacterium]|nr:hypothetical protein [Clostridia bacterium]